VEVALKGFGRRIGPDIVFGLSDRNRSVARGGQLELRRATELRCEWVGGMQPSTGSCFPQLAVSASNSFTIASRDKPLWPAMRSLAICVHRRGSSPIRFARRRGLVGLCVVVTVVLLSGDGSITGVVITNFAGALALRADLGEAFRERTKR
jgi:hypothetical protein